MTKRFRLPLELLRLVESIMISDLSNRFQDAVVAGHQVASALRIGLFACSRGILSVAKVLLCPHRTQSLQGLCRDADSVFSTASIKPQLFLAM